MPMRDLNAFVWLLPGRMSQAAFSVSEMARKTLFPEVGERIRGMLVTTGQQLTHERLGRSSLCRTWGMDAGGSGCPLPEDMYSN